MNPPIVYEVTKPINQRRTNMTVMVQSIFHLLPPWSSDKHSQKSGIFVITPPNSPWSAREVFLPALTHVDEDVDSVRRIQREESPCQPQQVLVVVHPFIYSQFHYGPNGMSGVITEIAAVIQSIDRDRSHRVLLLPSSFRQLAHAFL